MTVKMEILKVEGLTKRFGGHAALNCVGFSVEKGEFLSILGPSGCGKTTLLRILIGLLPADSGKILLEGNDITNAPPDKKNGDRIPELCPFREHDGFGKYKLRNAFPPGA